MGATRIIQLSLVMAILVPVLLRWGRRRFRSESPRFPVDLGGGVPAVGTFLFCEVYALDVSWNVSIGRDILATLSVPAVDRYTVAGPGHSDQDIHGLFQVLAALARSFAGWAGVELLQAALGSVALLFAWRAARSSMRPGSSSGGARRAWRPRPASSRSRPETRTSGRATSGSRGRGSRRGDRGNDGRPAGGMSATMLPLGDW